MAPFPGSEPLDVKMFHRSVIPTLHAALEPATVSQGDDAMANPEDIKRAADGKKAWNRWAEANPKATADFSRASLYTANFRGFIFPGEANFKHCHFAEDADFRHCHFLGETSFSFAAFKRQADFSNCRFFGDVDFDRVMFGGNALFESSTFEAYTYVVHSHFKYANFKSAKFNRLEITHSTFRGKSTFNRASFKSAAFKGVAFEHPLTTFEAASFQDVPDFRSSSFDTPAIFHGMRVAGNWTGHRWNRRAVSSDDAEKYRQLKVLAADAKDFAKELDYFAEELRAKRSYETKGRAAIAVNVAYEWVSDFGRSIALPACWLAGLTIGAAVLRLSGLWPGPCASTSIVGSLVLSASDAGLLFGSDKWKVREAAIVICNAQYGLCAYVAGYLQSLFSLVLLFLIGLGLRNRFRLGSGN